MNARSFAVVDPYYVTVHYLDSSRTLSFRRGLSHHYEWSDHIVYIDKWNIWVTCDEDDTIRLLSFDGKLIAKVNPDVCIEAMIRTPAGDFDVLSLDDNLYHMQIV